MKFTSSGTSQFRGTLNPDGDHLLGKVNSSDLCPVLSGQMERGPADAATDVEHPSAGMERAAQPPAQILGGLVTSRADVVLTKDLLVPQDRGAAVLSLIVKLGL